MNRLRIRTGLIAILFLFALASVQAQTTTSSPAPQGEANQKDPKPVSASQIKPEQTPQPTPTAQPLEEQVTDLTGDWVFTIKFSGKPGKTKAHIIRDDDLETIKVSAETREFFKKEYPGYRAFAATTQAKDGKVSESWIVLVKGGDFQLRTKLFGCVGILTVESTPEARIARGAKGTCLIPSINENGSLEATRVDSVP